VAEKAALRLIAHAEQNSRTLTVKLLKKGFDADVIKEVVSRFLDRNLLNDTRYAELWIRSRLSGRKKLSPLWLLGSLGKKGIDKKSSQKALENVLDEETEYSLLLNYVEKMDIAKSKVTWVMKKQLKKEGFSPEALDRFYSSSI
jgi:regulatory protein